MEATDAPAPGLGSFLICVLYPVLDFTVDLLEPERFLDHALSPRSESSRASIRRSTCDAQTSAGLLEME